MFGESEKGDEQGQGDWGIYIFGAWLVPVFAVAMRSLHRESQTCAYACGALRFSFRKVLRTVCTRAWGKHRQHSRRRCGKGKASRSQRNSCVRIYRFEKCFRSVYTVRRRVFWAPGAWSSQIYCWGAANEPMCTRCLSHIDRVSSASGTRHLGTQDGRRRALLHRRHASCPS